MNVRALSDRDPLVRAASIWPLDNPASREAGCNIGYAVELDGKRFWSDGFYMERGVQPDGVGLHGDGAVAKSFTLAEMRKGGRYVPVTPGACVAWEEETWEMVEDAGDPEAEYRIVPGEPIRTVACWLVNATTGARVVAVQAKYLNRIQQTCAAPQFFAAVPGLRTSWPVIAWDGAGVVAAVMPLREGSVPAEPMAERIDRERGEGDGDG
jgi:hypothetical protein